MSDDLVKRLRQPWDVDRSIMSQTERWMAERKEAAARIEELEAKLAKAVEAELEGLKKLMLTLAGDKIDLVSELAGVKFKLAKALEFIQDLTGCEWPYCEDAKRILAELTGETDGR